MSGVGLELVLGRGMRESEHKIKGDGCIHRANE